MECRKTSLLLGHFKDYGATIIPYVGSTRAPRGYPDRIIWHKDWQGWVEFKDVYTAIAPLQRQRIKDLCMRDPGSAYIVRFSTRYDVGRLYGTADGIGDVYHWNSPRELLDLLISRPDMELHR